MTAEVFFVLCLFLGSYPYLIYPPLVLGLSRAFGRPWRKGRGLPRMSIVVSVYNEEKVIGKKIENALALRYPHDLIEILVVSDGSTDRTNAIVRSFDDSRVVLHPYAERKGKTACLNRAVPSAKGGIVLFTDANSMFPPDLLLRLAENFSDPVVGLVTGWTRYRTAAGEEVGLGLYSRLEKITKEAESRLASCVGADGAVFALRRELYRPLREEDINDFVIPLRVVGEGKRAVLDPRVYCFEEPSDGEEKEFRRQVRITNRTLGAIMRNPGFLNPFSYGWFAFFLFSHKVIRFLVPFFFAGTFASSLWLAERSALFAAFAVGHLLFVAFGLAALRWRRGGSVGRLCSFFLLTIAAQFIGWVRWITGKSDVLWTPQR